MPRRPDLVRKLNDLLLNPEQRHVEPRAGQIGHCRMFREAKSINESDRTIDFVCSTAQVDRYGEIVEPEAFRQSLPDFLRNPAFPCGHTHEAANSRTPTVGHWRSMRIEEGKLIGTAWFKPRGLGEDCWLDYLEGNLTSVSVAFLTRAWEMREMEIDGAKRRVRVFTEADLLEVSAVLIPANPGARIRAAGFGGADGAPLLARLEGLVEQLEERLAADPDGYQRWLDEDDAGATRGHEGFSDGYFGDIPDADEPEPRAVSEGDQELKQALRDVLAAKAEHAAERN